MILFCILTGAKQLPRHLSIKAIFDAGGISHISKALFSPGIEKTHFYQEPACGAISIILAKDAERIQAAIDNNIVPGLCGCLRGSYTKGRGSNFPTNGGWGS